MSVRGAPDDKTQVTREPMATEVPLSIGGFPVVRLLGEGGMGRVYACRDEKLDRIVAVKVLRTDLARQPALVERFLREARAMARIASPHVVTVYQVGERDDDGAPFLVMEMLEGEDLSARVARRGRLSPFDAVGYARDAVQGLAAAAEAGIIHRDVKPANLFVVDGRVKLTDFGLARPLDGDPRLTQEGLVVGTPHYLAPEAARGQLHDEASDIYALGATLFELLTGHPPYPGQAALDVVSAHLTKPVPSVRKERPEVPLEVERLVKRMMAKQVKDRFRDYKALTQAIDEVLAHIQPSAFSLEGREAPPDVAHADARISSPTVKTATLTVMLTDIAGYTERTSQQSREQSARWLELHDALITPVLRAFGGRVVKTLGDAFLVTFSSPTDAVLCGTAIQDRLFLHNQRAVEPDRIRVRVALSAGEVRVHKGDVLGEPVNLVSRLEELARPGEVLLSDAVFSTMNVAEVAVDAVGEHHFKGISRPVKVYRARAVSEEGEPPFQRRALERAGLDELPGLPRRALGTTRSSLADLVLRRFGGSVRELAERVPGRGATLIAAGLVALLLVVVVGYLAVGSLGGTMSPEQAMAVRKQLGAVPRKDRSGAQELRLGHAHRALGDEVEALKAYQRALDKGARDDEALAYALSSLDEDESEEAVQLISAWPGDISKELVALLDDSWWPRHNALRALEKRGVATDAQRQEVGLKDLLEGETCGQRRFGLLLLKRIGIGPKVVEGVRAAGERMPDNLCMALDLAGVEAAVAARKSR